MSGDYQWRSPLASVLNGQAPASSLAGMPTNTSLLDALNNGTYLSSGQWKNDWAWANDPNQNPFGVIGNYTTPEDTQRAWEDQLLAAQPAALGKVERLPDGTLWIDEHGGMRDGVWYSPYLYENGELMGRFTLDANKPIRLVDKDGNVKFSGSGADAGPQLYDALVYGQQAGGKKSEWEVQTQDPSGKWVTEVKGDPGPGLIGNFLKGLGMSLPMALGVAFPAAGLLGGLGAAGSAAVGAGVGSLAGGAMQGLPIGDILKNTALSAGAAFLGGSLLGGGGGGGSASSAAGSSGALGSAGASAGGAAGSAAGQLAGDAITVIGNTAGNLAGTLGGALGGLGSLAATGGIPGNGSGATQAGQQGGQTTQDLPPETAALPDDPIVVEAAKIIQNGGTAADLFAAVGVLSATQLAQAQALAAQQPGANDIVVEGQQPPAPPAETGALGAGLGVIDPVTGEIVTTGQPNNPGIGAGEIAAGVGGLGALGALAGGGGGPPPSDEIVVEGQPNSPPTGAVPPAVVPPVPTTTPPNTFDNAGQPTGNTDGNGPGPTDYLTIGTLLTGLFGGGGGGGGTIPEGFGPGNTDIFTQPLPTLPNTSLFSPQNLGARNVSKTYDQWIKGGYGSPTSYFNYVPEQSTPSVSTPYTKPGASVAMPSFAVPTLNNLAVPKAPGADLLAAMTGKPQGLARGGQPDFAVRGPGSGRDDRIPAALSDGEYVMDAETVALLGDGSSDEGARRLDQFRVNIRKHKGQKLARGQFSVKAKAPEAYLRRGRTK